MIVAINGRFKILLAYSFIKSLTETEKANLIKEALVHLHEVRVYIVSITCDTPQVHHNNY